MSKKIAVIIILGLIIIVFGILVSKSMFTKTNKLDLKLNLPRIMQLQSSAFNNNDKLPAQYTCDGNNINPPLAIADVPENTKSLVLVVDDPDSVGGNWSHWLVWNIYPAAKEIAENSIPTGASVGQNDFGKNNYGGPCPPSGSHRYFFKLYALDAKLDLPASADAKDLENAMVSHILDQAVLIGLYR